MIHFLNEQGPSSQFSSSFGQNLGQGLDELLTNRINQMRTRSGLMSMGIDRKSAKGIAQLPPQVQQEVIKNYLAAAESQGLEQALSGMGQGMGTISSDTDNLEALGASGNVNQAQIAQNLAKPNQGSLASMLQQPRLGSKHRMEIAKMQQQQTQHQQQRLDKLRAEKRQMTTSERTAARSETKEVYKKVNSEGRNARDMLSRLSRQKELVREDKLNRPGISKLLNSVGMNFALTPESQEFIKLSNEHIKGAKEIFGNRLTDADLKVFQQMIPNMYQSKEAKLRVIYNLQCMEEAKILRKQAMDEIIKANKGERPFELDSLIEERIAPKLDQIAIKYKQGLQLPKPKEKTYMEKLAGTSEGVREELDIIPGMFGGGLTKLLSIFKKF